MTSRIGSAQTVPAASLEPGRLGAAYDLVVTGPARPVSARVWRLPTTTGDVAVKRYLPDQTARAAKEAAILAHLASGEPCDYRVQAMRVPRAGAAPWIDDDRAYLVTDWVAGRQCTFDTFDALTWHVLGRSLAALHRRLDTLHLPGLPTLHARLLGIDTDAIRADLCGDLALAARLGRDAELRDHVDTCLWLIDVHQPGAMAAFPHDDPQCPIHHDYNQFNYVFDETGPPVILDWEAAIGAPRAYEVVRCLNHLPLIASALARSFVQGYLSLRTLPANQLAWAVDAACLQHGLKRWVVQGWLRSPAAFTHHLQGAKAMATRMAGARDRLIDFYQDCLETCA